jgi:diaminopimelate decarboxylase
MFHFAYDDSGRLAAESVGLDRIAREVGTPAYVYVQATLERHFRVFDAAFAGHPHLICYAVKANSSRAIMRLFAGMGSGADIVSGGELARALRAGIPANRIVFSGVGKTEREMIDALDAKILSFNVESEPELQLLGEVARQRGTTAPISLRVNPDIDAKTHPYIATGLKESKFGIPMEQARRLAATVASHPQLRLTGVDCHIGSQLTTLEPLTTALDSVLRLVDELDADGHRIEHVDLGGGLGIAYKGETPPHPNELGAAVVARMKGRRETLILEPGRVIVGNAGILLTRVLYVKHAPARTFVIVDAAMNDLMRPSLYQAHHEIWPVEKRADAKIVPVDVVGPVCESSDTFAKQRPLQEVKAGDLLAIMSAGAYGFAMSSTYNSRPRACEVLVHGDRFSVVRKRETVEALMEGELLPDWL